MAACDYSDYISGWLVEACEKFKPFAIGAINGTDGKFVGKTWMMPPKKFAYEQAIALIHVDRCPGWFFYWLIITKYVS